MYLTYNCTNTNRGYMYTFGKHTDINVFHIDEEYTYLSFIGIDLRVSKDFIVERKNPKGIWKPISWHDNGNHQMRTSIYNGDIRKTLSKARVICIAAHGLPPADKQFVKHINGDTLDDSPENLQWADSLVKSAGAYRTEDNIKRISEIPEGQRNWSNPAYQKLFNHMKGSDGLTHAERYRLKMKALGMVRRKREVNGVVQWVWMSKDAPTLHRGRKKSQE